MMTVAKDLKVPSIATPHSSSKTRMLVVCGRLEPPDVGRAIWSRTDVSVVRTNDEFVALAPDAEVLLLWDFEAQVMLAHLWPSFRQLKWIHLGSVGADRVLFPELVASSVIVTNSADIPFRDNAIAEYAIGLVFLYAKGILKTAELQAARRWEPRYTTSIAGASLLVVGFGPIGRAVGRLALKCSMQVTAVSRRGRQGGEGDGFQVRPISQLPEAIGGADYVVLALPETPETRGLIDMEVLRRMRRSAVLINVGRGATVVESDLIQALQEGLLAGFAADAFMEEPLPPTSPLWTTPNSLVSPHMCGDLRGWESVQFDLFVSNLKRWVYGRPLANVLDKRLGYVSR
jgi:phosphoglycerate dehydrogenase-like enzyme